jgi:hypothetical protein
MHRGDFCWAVLSIRGNPLRRLVLELTDEASKALLVYRSRRRYF